MLVSKKNYPTWRQIQEEFPDFMTSLGPWPLPDALQFLEDEYPAKYTGDDGERIKRFLKTDSETLALFKLDLPGCFLARKGSFFAPGRDPLLAPLSVHRLEVLAFHQLISNPPDFVDAHSLVSFSFTRRSRDLMGGTGFEPVTSTV
jgi:hypothetical protein